MRQFKSDSARTPVKPGIFSLLLNILKGAFSNGMQLPALAGIGLVALLYHEQYPYHEAIAALLFCSLLLVGLFRGCINWQEELVEYQRDLALTRHQAQRKAANRGDYVSGFVTYTRR